MEPDPKPPTPAPRAARKTAAGRGAAANAVAEPALAARRRGARPLGADAIYERILGAVIDGRLRPGTQLVEEKLAAIFDVSRTKIREATTRLVHDGVAINIPNRGAFIASPSAEQAREVLHARRLIEPDLVRTVAQRAAAAEVARLRAHVQRETAAREGAHPSAIISLSGEFHLILAELAGNRFLARTLRDLEALTCLVIAVYDAPLGHACPYDDHTRLVDAIEARDADAAARLMLEHLDHIEASLDLRPRAARELALEDVLR